ncbi:MAG: site-specific DNA-methyltransferase, partial [Anaerolineae bacterium]|nr:site-specific DNA-methyltransferase [Anaerolineae bacterium]
SLRPAPEESVNWDTTQHLFIEGENLEVLKLLYKAYFGRVKMIYIDPPYNTGNDFIYRDDYRQPRRAYLEKTGQIDAEGNVLTSNPEASGRYHSDWLTMMYPRLFLARQLLREDGVIWISIDDTEVSRLRLLCDEIFGEENFVATFIWEKRTTRENRRVFSFNHDFIVCYARNSELFQASRNLLPLSEEVLQRYSNPDNDPRGDWQSVSLNAQAGHATPAQFYTITTPGGRSVEPPSGRCWSVTEDRLQELIADNRVWFGPDGNNIPRLKVFLDEAREGLTPHTLWKADEVGTNDSAKKALLELFSETAVFDTPKPVALLKRIVQISTSDGDLVLDFFAGSSTTAQAALELNGDDGCNRVFVLIQLPESVAEDSVARKEGFETIADIGKERIRRIVAQMQVEREGQLPLDTRDTPEDLGFRVFKLAPSNFRQWEQPGEDADALAQQLTFFDRGLEEGADPQNVIYEVILKEGYPLTSRIETLPLEANLVYRITDTRREDPPSFYLCLDAEVHTASLDALPLDKMTVFICRDTALSDSQKVNLAAQCVLKVV